MYTPSSNGIKNQQFTNEKIAAYYTGLKFIQNVSKYNVYDCIGKVECMQLLLLCNWINNDPKQFPKLNLPMSILF